MKTEILENIADPVQLEKLYRSNKSAFKRDFNLLFPDIRENVTAKIWNERLNFESDSISFGAKSDLLFTLLASIVALLIAKLPEMLGIDQEYFFERNIAFVVLPILTFYYAWKEKISMSKCTTIAAVFLISIVYINVLPDTSDSDTSILACIHLPLFLWTITGYAFTGKRFNDPEKRMEYLKYNGDLLVMTAIILLGGMLMSALTLGLFSLLEGIHIEDFYVKYIAVWGLASSPIVANFLIQSNPQLVNKVSPVIAKVFTPLVLIMLTLYLLAIIYTGKDPYNDREFLLIFNALLIGVMAIILFSIAGTSKVSKSKLEITMLLALAAVTIIINGIAISAIIFRISEWGITPNRLAVLGGNILILINLLLVSYRLFNVVRSDTELEQVEQTITSYLPVYSIWTLIVAFIFPLIFQFT